MHRRHSLQYLCRCAAKSTSLGASTAGSGRSQWLVGPNQLPVNVDWYASMGIFRPWRTTMMWSSSSASSSSSVLHEETIESDLVIDPLHPQQNSDEFSLYDPRPTNRSAAKSGSSSPWAVYDDVWCLAPTTSSTMISTTTDSITPEQMSLLGPESVKIDESVAIGSETKILEAYNSHLKSRTSSHFGYPYNLDVRVDRPSQIFL